LKEILQIEKAEDEVNLEKIDETLYTTYKLLNNIYKNPNEKKYRKFNLKKSKKIESLVSEPGVLRLLKLINFKSVKIILKIKV
jgi:hypothetical protein